MRNAYASYQVRMGGNRLPPMELDYASEIIYFPTWVGEYDHPIVDGLTMLFEKGFATIVNIAVHSDFQEQGLGGGLMKFAESQTRENCYSEMRLTTHILPSEDLSV